MAAVIATVFMMGRQGQQTNMDTTVRSGSAAVVTSTPTRAEAEPSAPASDSAVPEAEKFVVLTSSPVSASVSLPNGKELCATTPCRISEKEFVDRRLTVEVKAPSYGRVKREVVLDEEKVNVELRRIHRGAVPNATTTEGVPTGYKGDPFGSMPMY